MALTVTDLTVTIGDRAVVDTVTFAVPDGGRFGIIGESGSGKTLTALAVTGLLPASASVTGSVDLDGRELLGASERELARIRGDAIGMVFQEPRTALNPLRRVGRQMSEPLRLHYRLSRGQARQAAVDLAARVGLPEPDRIVDRYPHELSGGQRQRVGIAIAVACNPGLLIADEPTTALDVTVQAAILDLFDRLVAEQSSSLVFITHNLAVLARVCTDVVVMAGGRVIESGPTTRVVNAPEHPVTRGLVAAARATGLAPGGAGTGTVVGR
ncbi:ABC transporter ATP-binding protein [Tersicoccus phoenicis]|uniref:ABC transporter ATP-binding protein n=1 Tax=Tersicoccus phoenicis TaxID=554083 RepID=A0A1R1LJP0_9MICC|nr:ABC transporter ATP-binding protein [Tersicoccus phoenicis]OMH27747.1 ABC transporter ATP-binding protein [Tersicoccus phoenicis]